MVEEGKHVSEGDFLLEFDGSDLNRRLREDTANFQRVQEEYQKKRSDFDIQVRDLKLQLEQAKADLDKLENKLSRQAELESAIVIAETQIRRDMAKKKVELLAIKLDHVTESGRIDLQISRTNENHYRSRMDTLLDAIESLTVTSPVAGVVIYKRDWNNEPRQVGSYVFVLDTVLEIPDLSSMRAKVMVDEVDAGKVQVGQEAQSPGGRGAGKSILRKGDLDQRHSEAGGIRPPPKDCRGAGGITELGDQTTAARHERARADPGRPALRCRGDPAGEHSGAERTIAGSGLECRETHL